MAPRRTSARTFPFYVGFLAFLSVWIMMSTSALADQKVNIRAELQGSVLHFQWDPLPSSNGVFRTFHFTVQDSRGGGFWGDSCLTNNIGVCPNDLNKNSFDIDLTYQFSIGMFPKSLPLSVVFLADLGNGNRVTGQFVGTLSTPPITLDMISGDNQKGIGHLFGGPLRTPPNPFVIQATRLGQPLGPAGSGGALVEVKWRIAGTPPGASGQFIQDIGGVGPGGFNEGFLVFGDKDGGYTSEAYLCDMTLGGFKSQCDQNDDLDRVTPSVRFTASTGALQLKKISGDGLTGRIAKPLTQMLVVQVADSSGIGVPGKTVNFAPQGPGASVSPTSAVTDPNGMARTSFILGKRSGIDYTMIAQC
jgi:hypothetical protein